jgi:hypothetical protein
MLRESIRQEGRKKKRGKKNRIMLNMLIAVAVGEDTRQTGYWLRKVKNTSERNVFRLGRNSLEVTQPTIMIQLPIHEC